MKKKFKMANDVGIEVNYTVLGIISNNGKDYVLYTNGLPADNKFGKRILAGLLVNEEPIDIKKLRIKEEKEIVELFIEQVIESGKTIRKKEKNS